MSLALSQLSRRLPRREDGTAARRKRPTRGVRACEVPGHECVDVFVGPTGSDTLERLRQPCVGINVV